MPPAPLGSVVIAGLLVVGGATSMTFLAIAMAAGGADLSDEQTTAVGPATIYAFLLVGGLYNLVLTGDPRARLSGLALYLFVTVAYWGAGVARAEICFDAEAVRTPRLRTADAATLLLIYALGTRGLATAAGSAPASMAAALRAVHLGWVIILGLVALSLQRRAPAVPGRRGLVSSSAAGAVLGIVFAVGAGLLGGAAGELQRGSATRATLVGAPAGTLVGVALFLLAEELIFRGVLQRALEQDLVSSAASIRRARVAASVLTIALALIALPPSTGQAIALQIAATLARGITGRVSAAWLARLAGVIVYAFL
jgi:hypothetical protein